MNRTWNNRTWNDWAPLPLRLIMGIGFMIHGYPKLFGGGHEGTTGFFTNLGIPAPALMAWVVGIVEFFGGLLLILGAFTTVVATLCLIDMLVAIFVVHLPNGFLASGGGVELPLLYAAGFLALIIGGAGMLSVDRMMSERRTETTTTERPARETRAEAT